MQSAAAADITNHASRRSVLRRLAGGLVMEVQGAAE